MDKQQKQKGSGWSHEATRALISIWGEKEVQKSLDGVKRNRDIYQAVAKQLQTLGYNWDWQQCRTKIKNLTQNYRKVKDSNRTSGQGRTECPFYNEIDAILGLRAATAPPALLESSKENLGGDDKSGVSFSANVEEELVKQAEEDAQINATEGSVGSMDDVSVGGIQVPSSESKRDKKQESPDGLASGSSTTPSMKKGMKRKVQSELVTLLTKMEENAEERELKRIKLEAEIEEKRRQEERKHEEHMQTMMMGFMSQMMSMFNGHFPPPFPNPNQPATSYLPNPNQPGSSYLPNPNQPSSSYLPQQRPVPSYTPASPFDTQEN